MSALTDLQNAVTDLGTSISSEIQAATSAILLAQGADGSVAAADVEAVVSTLNSLRAKVDAETAALTPPPAPPPTGAPTPTS